MNVVPAQKEKMRLMIYDENGRLIIHRTVAQQEKINMSPYPSGLYTVIVWTEKNQIYKTSVIKQ